MKITIDTERKELTITDGTNLQELFEWCTAHLTNWSDYTIRSEAQQTTTWPIYPSTPQVPTFPDPGTTPYPPSSPWYDDWYTTCDSGGLLVPDHQN